MKYFIILLLLLVSCGGGSTASIAQAPIAACLCGVWEVEAVNDEGTLLATIDVIELPAPAGIIYGTAYLNDGTVLPLTGTVADGLYDFRLDNNASPRTWFDGVGRIEDSLFQGRFKGEIEGVRVIYDFTAAYRGS